MIFDSFRARVGVVVIIDRQILLIRDTRQETASFHLPGDIVKVNETLESAAKRAVKDQAGVDIEVGKLLYVRDSMGESKHRLDLFFLGSITKEPELSGKNPQFKADLININILESMDLLPKFLRKQILKDYKDRFRNPGIYVGALE